MTFLTKLERRFGALAIPNITLFLVIGQVLVYALMSMQQFGRDEIELVAGRVLDGEVQRLFSFVFLPPMTHPIFMAFAWYIFFIMGTALERHWGKFRYNLFILIGFVTTVAAAFVYPDHPTTNAFLGGSVFLAFAFLNPNFEMALFMVLPVKIKWLALVMWVFYGIGVVLGAGPMRLAILSSVANFALFFGGDIIHAMKARRRRVRFDARRRADEKEPFHVCHVCGKTDKSDPQEQFRYCSKCDGHYAYCEAHLAGHEHVREATERVEGER